MVFGRAHSRGTGDDYTMGMKDFLSGFRALWPGLVPTLRGEAHPIFMEYPVRPKVRFGVDKPRHPQLQRILDSKRSAYEENLEILLNHQEAYARIPLSRSEEGLAGPVLVNDWMPALDSLALYAFLREFNPKRYYEIGSGNSTKFARRAIRDGGLRTRLVSLDPYPRE